MICCEGFFQRNNCPKYLQPVCDMMQKVDECAFLSDRDNFELFTESLDRLLKSCLIKGSTAYIHVSGLEEDKGVVSLYAKREAQDVTARLHFFRIRNLLEHDDETGFFKCVLEEFLVQKGGES